MTDFIKKVWEFMKLAGMILFAVLVCAGVGAYVLYSIFKGMQH